MPSVLQPWVEQIPMRMQSTLILGLRGPDTHSSPNIKKICRWLRGLAFKPANPVNVAEFMGEKPERILEKTVIDKELDFCSRHYLSHLMHAIEVIAYRHPDEEVSLHAYYLYADLCGLWHLMPEVKQNFERRLRQVEWPGGVQPNTYEEAMAQLTGKG